MKKCNRHKLYWKGIQAVLKEHMTQLVEADVLGGCTWRALPPSAGYLLSLSTFYCKGVERVGRVSLFK